MAMSKEQLLAKQPVVVKPVRISTGEIFVRQMNGKLKNSFDLTLGYWQDYVEVGEAKERYVRTMEDFRGKLAVHTICDKDGNLLLAMDDLPVLLENMSGPDLVLIAEAAQQLNKIAEADRQAVAKNSKGGPASASITKSVKQ